MSLSSKASHATVHFEVSINALHYIYMDILRTLARSRSLSAPLVLRFFSHTLCSNYTSTYIHQHIASLIKHLLVHQRFMHAACTFSMYCITMLHLVVATCCCKTAVLQPAAAQLATPLHCLAYAVVCTSKTMV
jgi:hypothetical protein